MRISEMLDLLENAGSLDRVSAPIHRAVQKLMGPRAVANALHGVWLGHPLHPALVQLPVGAFMSAAILDALPGGERPARVLIATGCAGAVPSAAAGLADWSDLHPQQQRVGLVHATANLTGVSLYVVSLAARRRGDIGAGKALAYSALGVLTVGAYLGGHLSYRQAAGANHAEEVPHLIGSGWQDLCAVDDLPGGDAPQRRFLDTVPLFVLRRGDRIDVLSDRCAHLSGPLHEGTLSEDGSCITCPWHGSTFRLDDGLVVQGPATAAQPRFDVRVSAGRVEVRLPNAG